VTFYNSISCKNPVARLVIVTFVSLLLGSVALAQGNAEDGAGLTTVCVACHGMTGNENTLPNVPKLGGQGEKYLLKQLLEIKSGVRAVPLMTGMLTAMNDQNLADVAAYYSSLAAPEGAVEESKLALGEKVFRAGIASIGVAACSACHAPDGKGNAAAGFPTLNGQNAAYTDLQLRAWRAGERTNDEAEVMRTIAARMNDAEIAAVASYVSGLR
jgi:cytochrome c553